METAQEEPQGAEQAKPPAPRRAASKPRAKPRAKAKPKAKGKPGRPRFQKSEEQSQEVQRMRFAGYDHARIAAVLGISTDTLTRYFPDELENTEARLMSNIAATAYQKALAGDTACIIFLCKTRLGWRETERKELTGPNGTPLPMAAIPPLPLVEFVDGDPADDEPVTEGGADGGSGS